MLESMHQLEGSKKSVEEESACLWISSHEKKLWDGFTRNNPASKLEGNTEVGGHRMITNIFNQIAHKADEKCKGRGGQNQLKLWLTLDKGASAGKQKAEVRVSKVRGVIRSPG